MCAEMYRTSFGLKPPTFLVGGKIPIVERVFGTLLAVWLFVVVYRTLTGDGTYAGLSVAC
jgi:hypothetical protein